MVQLGESGLLYSNISCPRLRCKFSFVLFLLWAGKVVGEFSVAQRHILLSFPPSGWRTPLVLKEVKGLHWGAGRSQLVNRLGESWPQAVLRQGSGLSGLRGGNLAHLLVNRCSCLSPAPCSPTPRGATEEKGIRCSHGCPFGPMKPKLRGKGVRLRPHQWPPFQLGSVWCPWCVCVGERERITGKSKLLSNSSILFCCICLSPVSLPDSVA